MASFLDLSLQVDVKSLDAGPGVTKHVYVMEPDVPGGSVHPSILGMAHVRGDKEVITSVTKVLMAIIKHHLR